MKQFAVCLALIAKLTKVDAKLMKLELKCTKSKLNYAISKLATKVGNLELKIDVQYECLAKLSGMTRKLPKSESKWVFLSWKAEMLSNNSSKTSNSPSCLFLGEKG